MMLQMCMVGKTHRVLSLHVFVLFSVANIFLLLSGVSKVGTTLLSLSLASTFSFFRSRSLSVLGVYLFVLLLSSSCVYVDTWLCVGVCCDMRAGLCVVVCVCVLVCAGSVVCAQVLVWCVCLCVDGVCECPQVFWRTTETLEHRHSRTTQQTTCITTQHTTPCFQNHSNALQTTIVITNTTQLHTTIQTHKLPSCWQKLRHT